MKISVTFDLDKQDRVGIANYLKGCEDGDNPPADYKTCKDWILYTLEGELTVLDFHGK
tara:strand:- start:531 stop:704 length:174 start_codon:yes stop_codon:yes gene_type:complete